MGCGLLVGPRSYPPSEVARWSLWAADNDCFNIGEHFDSDNYLAWLDRLPRDGCKFALAPDVPFDWRASIQRSAMFTETMLEMGFPVALALQEGATPASVPWEGGYEAVFIGGSRAWKWSGEVAVLVQAARERGMWVHWGRANSYRTLSYARAIGCDSADGTFLRRAPDLNIVRMREWFRKLDRLPTLPLYETA